MSEERLQLMEGFRHDMTGIEPTTATHDDNPHPSFKRDPLTFKFEHSKFLFSVWNAGRLGAQSELAALREELETVKREFEIGQQNWVDGMKSLTAAEQRNAALTKAISDAEYRADQGKVWNGMGWTYTGLHSLGQQKVLDILRAALKPTESGASE